MPSTVAETARDYRQRASELRELSKSYTNEDARSDLLALADQWETMALRLERQAQPRGGD
ncbi:MAG: hypothetical protein HYR63_21180 [Proteobacteria bacterium]|nr:hypothetical protein [Pseudomonadota bacterium]